MTIQMSRKWPPLYATTPFQDEARAIRTKLIADLQTQLESDTKSGNLGAAIAARAEIERLKKVAPEVEFEEVAVRYARKVIVGGTWRLLVLPPTT